MKKPSKGFVRIPNDMFKVGLSLKAIGLYGYIKSKPPGWKFHINVILTDINEGLNAFRSGLKELKDKGYIKAFVIRETNGQNSGVVYQTNDYPAQVYLTSEKQTLGNQIDIYKEDNKTEEKKEEMRIKVEKLIHDIGNNMRAKKFY